MKSAGKEEKIEMNRKTQIIWMISNEMFPWIRAMSNTLHNVSLHMFSACVSVMNDTIDLKCSSQDDDEVPFWGVVWWTKESQVVIVFLRFFRTVLSFVCVMCVLRFGASILWWNICTYDDLVAGANLGGLNFVQPKLYLNVNWVELKIARSTQSTSNKVNRICRKKVLHFSPLLSGPSSLQLGGCHHRFLCRHRLVMEF